MFQGSEKERASYKIYEIDCEDNSTEGEVEEEVERLIYIEDKDEDEKLKT